MAWTYEQKFNALSTADLNGQDSWSCNTAWDVVTSSPYEGAKALYALNANNNATRAITGVTAGTFYFAVTAVAGTASDEVMIVMLRDASSNSALAAGMRYTGASMDLVYYTDGAITSLVSGVTLNTYYIVAVEFNTNADNKFRVKYKASGGSYSVWTAWQNPRDAAYDGTVTQLMLKQGSGGAEARLDSITPTDPEPDATNVTVSPSVLSATFSIPAATVTAIQNVTVSPAVLNASLSIPAASVSGGATVSAAVQSATFSIPSYEVLIADTTISASPLTATFSIPSYSVITDQVLMVSPLSATFSLPSLTVTTVHNVSYTPSPLTLTFSILTPTRIGGLWTNQERSSAATLTNQSRLSTSWDNQDRSES